MSLLSLVIEGTPKDGSVRYMHMFPEWFGGEIFPNLQELHVWHLDEMAYLPASIASFTALTELSLLEVGFNNQGEYERETHVATSILDPSILQITTLRTLNILHCDFKTLPAFFMPSLKFMRISACENLRVPRAVGQGFATIGRFGIAQIGNYSDFARIVGRAHCSYTTTHL